MPKYNCTITFGLSTRISPDGVRFDNEGPSSRDVTEFSDESYFSEQEVECDGGEIRCVVMADDEDDCESKLREIVEDGSEVEDDNSFTWGIDSVEYDMEEEALTVEEAIEVLNEWIANTDEERVANAAQVVLEDHQRLGQRVFSLESRLEEHSQRIAGLEALLKPTTESTESTESV